MTFMFRNSWHMLLGLRGEYFETSTKATKGVVHPLINDADNFDTLNYTYKMKNYLFLGNLQWLWDLSNNPFHPYLNMGLGVVWNGLFDYNETSPAGSTAAPMLTPFRDHMQSQLAYGFGIGFDSSIKHFGVQVGYQFLALGKAQLGTTRVQTTGEALKTDNIYLHLFELSFYFK